MKKTLSIILAMLMLCSVFSVSGIATVSAKETNTLISTQSTSGKTGDCSWSYDKTTKTLTISGNGAMGNYDDDTSADWGGNYSDIKKVVIEKGVTTIGNKAFDDCMYLNSVSIPNSVVEIGEDAFNSCTELENITIPDSVVKIGKRAFSSCDGLVSIKLPDNLVSLEDELFSWCSDLESVTISKSVKSIGKEVFRNTSSLESINVAEENEFFSSADGVLYDKDKTKLIKYPRQKSNTSFVVPNTVKTIGEEAFDDTETLKNITFPEGLTTIEDGAFMYCEGLRVVNIPDSVTSIGEGAFTDCDYMNTLTLGKGLTKLGRNAFYNCARVKSIVLPSSLTEIPEEAFSECYRLENIELPNTLTKIDEQAFRNCRFLKSINIPSGVTVIENNTFENCRNMESAKIPNTVTKIGEFAFSACASLKTIDIPESVTEIGYKAFKSCASATSINVLGKVKVLENYVFYDCRNATEVTLPETLTEVMGWAFTKCAKIEKVYFNGTQSQWKKIVFHVDHQPLTKAHIHYKGQVHSVQFDKTSATLQKNKIIKITATVNPTDAVNKTLKWKSSNTKVAKVNQYGKVRAIGGGIAVITATAVDGSNENATFTLTVKQAVTKVTLNKKSVTLKLKGYASQKSYTLKATVSPKDANVKSVTWKSSNTKVATVNSKGKVTAKKRGTCYITATAKDGSKKSAKCKIVVK